MELPIKQLKQHGKTFVPQTISEAVLVNEEQLDGTTMVFTLDSVLDRKVENIITPAGSGLQAIKSDKNIYINHSNSIIPNESASPVIIKYDGRGHIVETKPLGKVTMIINQNGYIQYDGSQDKNIVLGDDFDTDTDNNIILKWNHL